jgi:LAO/AO transport system kinase
VQKELVDKLLKGDRAAVARAISIIEDDSVDAKGLVKRIFKHIGHANTIGITGPAGAGKSTLIDKLIHEYRSSGRKVAVLAVDPTSAMTGGAILGDRVRMQKHALDEGTFIRSMASRGAMGGLSKAVRNAIRVLDVAGYDKIVIESVGAGQLDVEIAKIVDITIVVFNPQTGDSVQAIKAGLTEVGDIYVVNKADLPGADKLYNDVKDLIGNTARKPKVFKVVAQSGRGVKELVKGIEESIRERSSNYKELERRRVESELNDMVLSIVGQKVSAMLNKNKKYKECVELMLKKKMDPYEAAEDLAEIVLG